MAMLGLANMPDRNTNPYALLESSFQNVPNLSSHKTLPRPKDDLRTSAPEIRLPPASSESDDDQASQASSQHTPPLASPALLSGADTGLPPTPPSNSVDDDPPAHLSSPPHADSVVSSLNTKSSSLNTPVNNRSPPTPDPSPPRTTESLSMTPGEPLERPPLFAYPSSRAESFKTAKEDQYSSDGGSRLDSPSASPVTDRLSTVAEERGLGLAFGREDSDATPTNNMPTAFVASTKDRPNGQEYKDPPDVGDVPSREWDTNLMRNVTVRKRRNSKPSPRKISDSVTTTTTMTATGSPRRSSSLRERVQASKDSPRTASIENFARSIGWPAEASNMPSHQPRDADTKRLSGSSATSTVVEAMVIVNPLEPQRRRTLRHSGKNLAYRREGEPSAENSPPALLNRDSPNLNDYPLHRLVHKRAVLNGSKRVSSESDSAGLGFDRTASPLSIRKRGTPIDSRAHTLAHQESVRRVLQPAAEIMSRSNSVYRPYGSSGSLHKRIASAPETAGRIGLTSPSPRTYSLFPPPYNPKMIATPPTQLPSIQRKSPSIAEARVTPDINKALPHFPAPSDALPPKQEVLAADEDKPEDGDNQPLTFHDALSEQPAPETESQTQEQQHSEGSPDRPVHTQKGSHGDRISTVRRGSLSTRGRTEEQRRSFNSQDRSSTSRDALRPSMDRTPVEELPRHSHEWHHHGHGRVSFDRSTIQSDEHAMARHLFAQTTPFSQVSDTPVELSEATAVSIFPHNNHSLLVVQQTGRGSMFPGQEVVDDVLTPSSNPQASNIASSKLLSGDDEQQSNKAEQPTLTVEPSTPPMKILIPSHVDSPLKNPRAAPEPPVIQFIPPTPAEELERELPPGPPKRSDSHPQRRLTLVQRARRYSEDLISPLLARASSTRSQRESESHTHENPRIPTVNDQDGSLHPFWRPRGFWDGFDESDSDSEDDVLPQGGDTSDVTDPEPESSPGKLGNVLARRFSIKSSGGFLIGNSLGVERHGTNKRKPHIILPSARKQKPDSDPQVPRILFHPATASPHRVEKRASKASMRSNKSSERPRRGNRREAWRRGRKIPGVPRLQVQYIGISGVKERFRERKAEKRRDEIRQSIGSRYYYEGGTNVA